MSSPKLSSGTKSSPPEIDKGLKTSSINLIKRFRQEFTLDEQFIYGSSRIGSLKRSLKLRSTELDGTYSYATGGYTGVSNQKDTVFTYLTRYKELPRGSARFELANHLGNVLAVISDQWVVRCSGSSFAGYSATVIQAQDYSAFGGNLRGREYSLNSTNYLPGMNGQFKDNEIFTGAYTAEYWEYDSRLGRRWNIDPKPDHQISPYACFLNNPNLFIDVKGDTIQFTKAFSKDKYYMEAYNVWSKTETGKKFIKDYGMGGKYQNVSVWFDVSSQLTYLDEEGETNFSLVDKKTGKQTPLKSFEKNQTASNIANGLQDGKQYLKIKMTFLKGLDISNKAHFGKKYEMYIHALGAIAGSTIQHETQHVEITMLTLKKFQMMYSNSGQHSVMDQTYWKNERSNYMNETKNLWYDYYKKESNSKNEKDFIYNITEDFIR